VNPSAATAGSRTGCPPEVLARLPTSQGHLEAVVRIATQGAPAEDVLAQLRSVQAALSAARRCLLQAELRTRGEALRRCSTLDQRAQAAEALSRLIALATRPTQETDGG